MSAPPPRKVDLPPPRPPQDVALEDLVVEIVEPPVATIAAIDVIEIEAGQPRP
jgi:hypothetical protein